jgi:hypothetical protein
MFVEPRRIEVADRPDPVLDHAEFGLILRVIEHALSPRPEHGSWVGYTAWGTRSATP